MRLSPASRARHDFDADRTADTVRRRPPDTRHERELGLPEGPPFEVPLLIQDRNFALDDSGRLTGQLVHKTDPQVMEAFPPFTVVNGSIAAIDMTCGDQYPV